MNQVSSTEIVFPGTPEDKSSMDGSTLTPMKLGVDSSTSSCHVVSANQEFNRVTNLHEALEREETRRVKKRRSPMPILDERDERIPDSEETQPIDIFDSIKEACSMLDGLLKPNHNS